MGNLLRGRRIHYFIWPIYYWIHTFPFVKDKNNVYKMYLVTKNRYFYAEIRNDYWTFWKNAFIELKVFFTYPDKDTIFMNFYEQMTKFQFLHKNFLKNCEKRKQTSLFWLLIDQSLEQSQLSWTQKFYSHDKIGIFEIYEKYWFMINIFLVDKS